MSSFLFVASIGPIQEFIATARRTRDLWFGSELLSEVSKAVARCLKKEGADLIFPAPHNDDEVRSGSKLQVSNVILAKYDGELAPSDLAEKAKKAAQDCWNAYAKKAFDEAESIVEKDIWNDQVNDVIEFYSAWVQLPCESEYPKARERVMQLLAGRKALRNFEPAKGRIRRPKSSLDGARESIWKDPKNPISDKTPMELVRKLRLTNREQLDVVGLTKRLGTIKENQGGVPSVSRIAVDPWVRGVSPEDLKNVKEFCEKLSGYGKLNWKQFEAFSFEGTILYRNRHAELAEEFFGDAEKRDVFSEVIAKLEKKYGVPDPYFAVLQADGDRMGKFISTIDELEKHRNFTKDLAKFSAACKEIVEEHNGWLVYAGGDDVLAFLPVDKCFGAASELHKAFVSTLKDWKIDGDKSPTLSVGIAIGHMLDPLQDHLKHVREAEKSAKKPDKNGLAIHMYPRSGTPIKIRTQWEDKLVDRLNGWVSQFTKGTLPSSIPFGLQKIARDFSGWQIDDQDVIDLITNDIYRMLRLKGKGGTEFPAELRELILRALNTAHPDDDRNERYHPRLMALAEELLVTRRIAQSARQAIAVSETT